MPTFSKGNLIDYSKVPETPSDDVTLVRHLLARFGVADDPEIVAMLGVAA